MNAFDDHLKNQAGGFRMEPRKEVWERVAEELDGKKKKRRAIWFWWWVPLLVAGGAVWFSGNFSPEPEKISAETRKTAAPEHAGITAIPLPEGNSIGNSEPENVISRPKSRLKIVNRTPHTTAFTPPSSGKGVDFSNRPPEDVNPGTGKKNIPENNPRPLNSTGTAETAINDHPEMDSLTANPVDMPNTATAGMSVPPVPKNEPAKTAPAAALSAQPVVEDVTKYSADSVSVSKSLQKEKKAGAGTWRLVTGMGLHNHTGKGITLDKSMADYNSGGLNNNAGGGQNNPQGLASPEPGWCFMAGIERSAPFGKSRHWSWMGALHYQYQTYKTQTGTRVDTALNYSTGRGTVTAGNYYRSGNSVSQTGWQHRAHLLAAVQWHPGKKQRWILQNGLYGGMVLASDYLVPQSSPRGWVPAKGLTQSGYLGIETGILYRPAKWGAGIFGQYNLSNSLKVSGPAPQYWRGVELRIQYNLSANSR